MVRRLIHQQQVARLDEQLGEGDARLLATRQHLDRLVGVVAAEHERAEDRAHARRWRLGRRALDDLIDRRRQIERVGVVLRVVPDLDVVADLDRAAIPRQLAGDHPQQRGLAGAVDADDADLFAALDREVDAREHDVIAVRLPETLDLDRLGNRT